jgi:YHS domain-containing protein
VLRLFTLGANEATVLEVEAQPLTGYVKAEGGTESDSFVLAPKPQPGDKTGMTSLFVGHLPKEVAGKKVEVTIPSIRIGNERFRIAFKSVPDAGEHAMPAKVADDDERKLYLTPGGIYTAADIQANGNATASQKFKGLKAEHDLKPKPGDQICPVTLTKANPKFTWVIGGKSYQFCCPPCVDEFVALAKEKPADVQPPEFYRQK